MWCLTCGSAVGADDGAALCGAVYCCGQAYTAFSVVCMYDHYMRIK